MKKVVTVALLTALTSPAVAQKDRIVWTDGTVANNVRVRNFTWREVTFTNRSREEQTRSADAVAKLTVAKVKDEFRRGYGAETEEKAFSAFMAKAEELSGRDPFLAQWGYLEAARLHLKRADYSDAFAVLEEMTKKLPDTGFYPELFRVKLDYYLAQGKDKARSAMKVARDYAKTALENAWPDGFVHEASYYELMAQNVGGEVAGTAFLDAMKALLRKTQGAYPSVADRVRVQIAGAHLEADELDAARHIYDLLVDKEGLDETTRAQALIGLGLTNFQSADPTNTEPYREAMLDFLRVYIETPDAAKELRAEALYQAALSAEKWRGPDSGAMARRLRSYLRRDFPESPWASR